jgi:hypothetical protein
MNNLQKLLDLVKENPDLPIVPMVYSEIVADDGYSYWTASFGECKVTKIYYSDERVYFEDDTEDLVSEYMDCNYDSHLSDEELEKEAEQAVAEYDWKKVIVVYIELP